MKYIELNNQVMQRDENGAFMLDKDKEAVREYFKEVVNRKMLFTHNTDEKLDYLIENDYYDTEVFAQYSREVLNELYDIAYDKKFRFNSLMAAFKFYNDYALLTDDKKTILERYEDRIVANAVLLARGNVERAKRFVKRLIEQEVQPATPTFLNSGRSRRGELVSCFLLEMGDSLNNINMGESTSKSLSKIGGGVSTNLSKIRAKGEAIKKVENVTKGVVGVMKMLDHAYRYADQMGQRPGSGSVYLHVMHPDIFDYLGTKKINADEDFRVKTLSIGVVIPDKFIQLAADNKTVYLFYPGTVFKEYGVHFDDMNLDEMYDELVANPNVRKEAANPREILEYISALRFESGYPYIMYRDNCNRAHNLNNLGEIKFSNLCSEILQYSSVSEYTNYGEPDVIGQDISCNLSSLNIYNVMRNKSIEEATTDAIEMLTAVSDLSNIENAPGVRKANEIMHSVGLGAMNLHGYLATVGIPYESDLAIEFADVFFATVNYWTLVQSNRIAVRENTVFHGFDGSKYSTGEYFDTYINEPVLPVSDKIKGLFEGIFIPTADDWAKLKVDVMATGLYHSYRLAIAPNGSSSYLQGATSGVMPAMERIEERTYGNSKTYYPMPFLSPKTWFLYKEAYDMDMCKVIDLISTIQRHVDQGISFTLFLKDTMTTRDLTKIDLYAHHKGIKTTYYARTKDTGIENCLSCQV